MIADLDEAGGDLPTYDLCIVGSGPAGATVAAELVGSGLRLCVLESGRLRTTRRGDELRATESRGIHVKDYSRERVLGGASTTWAGLSSPLDAIDLGPRPELGWPGWPIERTELLGLYEQAAARYRFPRLEHFGEDSGLVGLRAKGDWQGSWTELEEKVFLACSEPQDFGREQKHVYEGEDVDLWLDATVTSLERDAGGRVAAARLRTRSGHEHVLRARGFVLATGGIENARLLLVSGLGGEATGRYLMNHPKNYHGLLHLARPVEKLPYYFGCMYEGFAGYGGLRLREEVLRERGLLNSYVRLEPLFPWSDSTGIEALVLLAKRTRFLVRRLGRRSREEVVELRDYSETGDDSDLQNERKSLLDWLRLPWLVVTDLRRVSAYLWFRLVARRRPRIKVARLRNFMEMEPRPENRVTLSQRLDPNGVPLPRVEHDTSELDRRSLVELHRVLARELEAAGAGRLETSLDREPEWPITQDASHHMGTTRMGQDPATSVVDRDLALHGVEGLWLAGASVFPTSGCANPTFTIVALSIRLAAHLRRTLGARP